MLEEEWIEGMKYALSNPPTFSYIIFARSLSYSIYIYFHCFFAKTFRKDYHADQTLQE